MPRTRDEYLEHTIFDDRLPSPKLAWHAPSYTVRVGVGRSTTHSSCVRQYSGQLHRSVIFHVNSQCQRLRTSNSAKVILMCMKFGCHRDLVLIKYLGADAAPRVSKAAVQKVREKHPLC